LDFDGGFSTVLDGFSGYWSFSKEWISSKDIGSVDQGWIGFHKIGQYCIGWIRFFVAGSGYPIYRGGQVALRELLTIAVFGYLGTF
jgi:hypothetical protein